MIYKLKKEYIAYSEVDNFESGCDYESSSTRFLELDEALYFSKIRHLVSFLCTKFNVSEDSIAINSCEEDGRVDIEMLTVRKFKFNAVSKNKLKQWQNGDIDLFYNTISVYVSTSETGFPDSYEDVRL